MAVAVAVTMAYVLGYCTAFSCNVIPLKYYAPL